MTAPGEIGAVVIGRNEGERLLRCLASVCGAVDGPVIYVDSGSNDGSVAAAAEIGAEVVVLDPSDTFTAARARNAGIARLASRPAPPAYVQFIDGDCELREGWIPAAVAFLAAHPDVAVACGRRRERRPAASRYNRLIDAEWDTPVGEARACGGDALMRMDALSEAGGFDPTLIAGEEPELCVRLREAGWRIWRLDLEMTWHDAAMMRFSQWWRRTRRAGHAFAEGAARHGAGPQKHNVAPTRRALLWGGALPVAIVLGSLLTPWAALLALLWPLKVARLVAKGSDFERAFFLTLGNVPEAFGVLEYWIKRTFRRKSALIEYK